jgi:pimeloyl-ACP methyl ester carboxylesterase
MTGDRPAASDVNAVIDAHLRSGYRLAVGGVETFVLDLGHGQPVVCLHGVPVSSFLYRKLIVELAARGLRGIAFDLPGLGLAERPAAFDYTWTGLGRFASAARSPRPGSVPSWCTILERRWGSKLRKRM